MKVGYSFGRCHVAVSVLVICSVFLASTATAFVLPRTSTTTTTGFRSSSNVQLYSSTASSTSTGTSGRNRGFYVADDDDEEEAEINDRRIRDDEDDYDRRGDGTRGNSWRSLRDIEEDDYDEDDRREDRVRSRDRRYSRRYDDDDDDDHYYRINGRRRGGRYDYGSPSYERYGRGGFGDSYSSYSTPYYDQRRQTYTPFVGPRFTARTNYANPGYGYYNYASPYYQGSQSYYGGGGGGGYGGYYGRRGYDYYTSPFVGPRYSARTGSGTQGYNYYDTPYYRGTQGRHDYYREPGRLSGSSTGGSSLLYDGRPRSSYYAGTSSLSDYGGTNSYYNNYNRNNGYYYGGRGDNYYGRGGGDYGYNNYGLMRRGRGGYGRQRDLRELWDMSRPITVQGGSLKTWSFSDYQVDQVQVLMKTEGRPLDAIMEVWQGPGHTPQKLRVYMDDGASRTFAVGVPMSGYYGNTVSIRNVGMMEFPIEASAEPDRGQGISAALAEVNSRYSEQLQGGATRTYPFEPDVDSVAVLLRTDGRPLHARIELLNGPNNEAQVMEMYSEDGMDLPLYAVIDTPGPQNAVRVVNTATMEFPIMVNVAPYTVGRYYGGRSNAGRRLHALGQWRN